MYQSQYNSTDYNQQQQQQDQQQYYNYYYSQQQQQQQQQYPAAQPTNDYSYSNSAPVPAESALEPPPPNPAPQQHVQQELEKPSVPNPPVVNSDATAAAPESNTEQVDMEMEIEPEAAEGVVEGPQNHSTAVASGNTSQYPPENAYSEATPTPQDAARTEGSQAGWNSQQQQQQQQQQPQQQGSLDTPVQPQQQQQQQQQQQWYQQQQPQGSWEGGAGQSAGGWGNNYSGNWQNSNSWSSPQQQYPGSNQGTPQQHYQQWGGGWGQWAGQGGGQQQQQWGQWQPGVEAWAGQSSYGYYQQQGYGYPQNYQQQQPNYQGSPSSYLASPQQQHLRRSRSPGTPPLPDIAAPAKPNQTETPSNHYQAYPHVQAAPTGTGGRKHQRGEEPSAVGKPNSKRMHVEEGKEGGHDQPLPPTAAEKGGSGRKKYGSRGRWSDIDDRDTSSGNYSAVPPPNLPLPTPNAPPRGGNYSYSSPTPHHHHPLHNSQQKQQQNHQPYPSSATKQGANHMPAPTGSTGSSNNAHPPKTDQAKEATANAASDSASKDNMPEKMKEYVARAFASAKTEEERDVIHKHLDTRLNQIFAKKQQFSIDWDNFPMPLDEIKKKPASRWDTPSPDADLTSMRPPSHYSPRPSSGQGHQGGPGGRGYHATDGSDDEGWGGGFGRGRGGKRKKNRKKKGKNNKFFIDNTGDGSFGGGKPLTEVSQEDKARINQRINRFGKQGGHDGTKKKLSIDDMVKSVTLCHVDDQIYWQDSSVEGTSQALEKRYLRLTSAPDPSVVRPPRVLRLSLKHVCEKWHTNKDYHYACEQFKSIRQDLTIQGVRDEFTVEVYETHARVALENNDREEFNQCQTQLMALYNEKAAGTYPNQPEFIAYRILYLILTKNTADMSTILLELTSDLKSISCIEHAQKLCSAWLSGNYAQFFRLYRTAPFMCGALINIFIERERKSALRTMAKAYRPNLSVSYISGVLGFQSKEDCLAFLTAVEAVVTSDGAAIDCKLTQAKLAAGSGS